MLKRGVRSIRFELCIANHRQGFEKVKRVSGTALFRPLEVSQEKATLGDSFDMQESQVDRVVEAILRHKGEWCCNPVQSTLETRT